MSNELAEQAESGITLDNDYIQEDATEESAPQEGEIPAVETPEAGAESTQEGLATEEAPKKDKFQDRINKVTADKYEEKRRADALQARLDKLEAQPPAQKQTAEPTLESCEFDEERYNSELINYRVDQRLQHGQQQQQEHAETQAKAGIVKDFNESMVKFAADNKIENINELLGNIPVLQPSVLEAVMQDKKGPELAHYLGTHLDQADTISQMNPIAAAIEIGKISVKLAEPKQVTTSSAPDPIAPVDSGGIVSNKERGPEGATFT